MKRPLGLLLATFIFLFTSMGMNSAQSAPTNSPIGISDDTWQAYYDRVFSGSGLKDRLMKFSGSGVTVSIFGNVSSDDVKSLNSVASVLKKYCSSYFPSLNFSSSNETGINIYFVPKSEYRKYIPTASLDESSNGYYSYYSNGTISKVTVVIDSDLSNSINREFQIRYRLLQSLGMWGNLDDRNFPLFANSSLVDDDLTAKDKELYSLFCFNGISIGDSFSEASRKIDDQLSKYPNQTPTLKSSSSLSLDADSINVQIKLNSLQEIWSSGETNLQWKILDKDGATFDSGEISNSENRLVNEWEVSASGLAPNSQYKFQYYFSNVIGDGKVETTSFRTSKDVAPEPVEKVEQNIMIYSEFPEVNVSQKFVTYEVSATSGLDVLARSDSPSVCTVDAEQIKLLKSGKCKVVFTQSGDDDFLAAPDELIEFNVKSSAQTITCIKGKTSKKISGINPKCPAGYKKK